MDFITQYHLANSGTEVAPRYTRWCAISLLGTVLGRKVYVNHGHFELNPWLYYCLIGSSGSGKSTACFQARDMLIAAIPSYPTGVSITSREDIVKYMSSSECARTYIDEKGSEQTWRPIANYADELSNFLSFAPGPMIEFMTTICDAKFYISRTIKRGEEMIINPYFSFMACTVPETMVEYLRMRVMGGGILRRLLLIYDLSIIEPITFPIKSPEAVQAEQWCIQHLQKLDRVVGGFTWAEGSREFLDRWNKNKKIPEDRLLAGYYGKKVNIVQKVAMCIACADDEPKLIFTIDNLTKAMLFLEANEDNLFRLTMAIGRNELSIPRIKAMEVLKDKGGMMPEKEWHRQASSDMGEREYNEMRSLLKSTDQLYTVDHMVKDKMEVFVVNNERYLEMVKKGEIKLK